MKNAYLQKHLQCLTPHKPLYKIAANYIAKRRRIITTKKKKKKKKNGKKGKKEDRLSSLPDAILISILSLLPAKSAITTSVLSRRYQHLWTQIISLKFNDYHFDNFVDHIHYSSIFTIISQVLSRINSQYIHKFSLNFNQIYGGLDSLVRSVCLHLVTSLESWLHQLCVRNIQEIEINPVKLISSPKLFPKLPPCVFQTPSLVVLELGPPFPYEFPTFDDRINLPNLNKLTIGVPDTSFEAFSKLISSCPSLEDLIFWTANGVDYPNNAHDYLDISSQSLKHLDMDIHWWFENTRLVEINAPKLVKLNVSSKLNRTKALESLLASLKSCPVLEVLTLSLVLHRKDDAMFTPPAFALACMSTHLKRIEMSITEGVSYDNLVLAVEYLLSKSRVIEEHIISIRRRLRHHYDEIKWNKEKQLCEQLYKIPRSLRCQIVFSGIFFKSTVPNGRIDILYRPKEVDTIFPENNA